MAHVSTDSDSITNFQQYKRVFLFTFVCNAFTRFKAKYTHKHIGKKNEHKSDDKESETGKYMHRAWCKIVCTS